MFRALLNCRRVRAGTMLRTRKSGYSTSQTIQIVFGRWQMAIADRKSGCVVPRLLRPGLRCARSMKAAQCHGRALQLHALAPKVQPAARRPVGARSALPWCLVAAAGPSPEAVRAFSEGSKPNLRFSSLPKRALAKRVFAIPLECAVHAPPTRK